MTIFTSFLEDTQIDYDKLAIVSNILKRLPFFTILTLLIGSFKIIWIEPLIIDPAKTNRIAFPHQREPSKCNQKAARKVKQPKNIYKI